MSAMGDYTGVLEMLFPVRGEISMRSIFSVEAPVESGGGCAMAVVVIVNRVRNGGWVRVSGGGGWMDEKMVSWRRWQRRSRQQAVGGGRGKGGGQGKERMNEGLEGLEGLEGRDERSVAGWNSERGGGRD